MGIRWWLNDSPFIEIFEKPTLFKSLVNRLGYMGFSSGTNPVTFPNNFLRNEVTQNNGYKILGS